MFPRIKFLRQQFFLNRPSVCLEAALAKTRVFRETGDMPHQDDHHPAAGADCRQCGREGPAGLHHAGAVEQLVRA